jgi:hypothetical protein
MAVCSGRNRIIGSGGILSHMLAKSLASHASIAGRNHALLSKGAGARFQEGIEHRVHLQVNARRLP